MIYVGLTGGLDSMFFLIDSLRRGLEVKAIYVKDIDERQNQDLELAFLDNLNVPVKIEEKTQYQMDLVSKWNDSVQLPSTLHLGAYAIEKGISLNVCTVKSDHLTRYVFPSEYQPFNKMDGTRVKEGHVEYTYFRNLKFPLIYKTKSKLIKEALHNFNQEEIQLLFSCVSCVRPVNGVPCGRCMSCRDNIYSGLNFFKNVRMLQNDLSDQVFKNFGSNIL